VPIYAEALARLGTERSFVVSGDEGLDELSLAGGNEVAQVEGGEVRMQRIDAQQAGWPTHRSRRCAAAIRRITRRELRKLLDGEPGPYRDAVLFNAAAALLVAGEVETWAEGVEEAAEAIDKGLAKALLDCWIASTR
jgi:anthranilate phosphoribosyltransferase